MKAIKIIKIATSRPFNKLKEDQKKLKLNDFFSINYSRPTQSLNKKHLTIIGNKERKYFPPRHVGCLCVYCITKYNKEKQTKTKIFLKQIPTLIGKKPQMANSLMQKAIQVVKRN